MKKTILFILALIFCGNWILHAQVVIGACDDTVHDGAVLELRPSGEKVAGLLMPRLALTSATVWTPVSGTATNGMTVYNTNDIITSQNELNGRGIYTWIDGRWYSVSSPMPCTTMPATPQLAANGMNANYKTDAFKPFLVFDYGAGQPDTWYEWSLPTGLIGNSNSNVITIVGTQPGAYKILAKAVNKCGASNEAGLIVIIENPIVLPPEDVTGNAEIQGVTCYDIAQTDDTGGPCGSLAYRHPAFPDNDPGKRTRPYLFSIQNNTSASNLRVGWTDDAAGIIKSVSGGTSGPLTLNEYPITVVFADNINDIVKNKADKKATAKLYAIYNENGTDKHVSLVITVQDCSCCPLDVAKVIENAAYKGADILDWDPKGTYETMLSHFTRIPNAALCVWKKDQGNPITNSTSGQANSWPAATSYCKYTISAAYGEGWRIPNLAEMYHNLHKVFYNDGGYDTSTNKSGATTKYSRYISNTANKANNTRLFFTKLEYIGASSNNNKPVQIDSGSVPRETPALANFRCVKTIGW